MNVLPIAMFVLAVLCVLAYSFLKTKTFDDWLEKRRLRNMDLVFRDMSDGVQHAYKEDPRAKHFKSRYTRIVNNVRLGMQVVVSIAVLAGATYIMISQAYDAKDKHWAYGAMGTLLGFWLKR